MMTENPADPAEQPDSRFPACSETDDPFECMQNVILHFDGLIRGVWVGTGDLTKHTAAALARNAVDQTADRLSKTLEAAGILSLSDLDHFFGPLGEWVKKGSQCAGTAWRRFAESQNQRILPQIVADWNRRHPSSPISLPPDLEVEYPGDANEKDLVDFLDTLPTLLDRLDRLRRHSRSATGKSGRTPETQLQSSAATVRAVQWGRVRSGTSSSLPRHRLLSRIPPHRSTAASSSYGT